MTHPTDITITLTREEARVLFYSRPPLSRPEYPAPIAAHILATRKLRAALQQTTEEGEQGG